MSCRHTTDKKLFRHLRIAILIENYFSTSLCGIIYLSCDFVGLGGGEFDYMREKGSAASVLRARGAMSFAIIIKV